MERQSQCSSSDEDDDGEALVVQNETKARSSPRRVASFEIGRLPARIGRSLGTSGKKYLFAVCLPLLLILLFFSVDVGGLFRGVFPVRFAPHSVEDHQMREAELRALYLLRNQQLGLRRLWNRTSAAARLRSGSIAGVPPPAPPFSGSNSTPNSSQTVSRGQGAPSQI